MTGNLTNMKNIKMTSLTKFLIPVLIGAFSFNSYAQRTKLERYNQRNKKIHEDFTKFCGENANKIESESRQYKIEFPNKKYYIDFDEGELFLSIHINADTVLYDIKGDGLDNKLLDSYFFRDKNKFIDFGYIQKLFPEEQLLIAEKYTDFKKQIMHDEKYLEY